MEVHTRDIHYTSRTDKIIITPLGDSHIGSASCNLKLLRACVKHIANSSNHYWIGMGDYGEFIMPDDKRFEFAGLPKEDRARAMGNFLNTSFKRVAAEFLPIKDKCLGLLRGNHENTVTNRYFFDSHEEMCLALANGFGDLNCGYSAVLRLKLMRGSKAKNYRTLRIYAHHGAGGGRKKGAKINRVTDLAASFPGNDIYVMGHVHDRVCFVDTALDILKDQDRVVDRPMAFGVTGTFLETYTQGVSNYGERAQYPPTALGVISFVIHPCVGQENRIEIDAHSGTNGLPYQ